MNHKYKIINLSTLIQQYEESVVLEKMDEYKCPMNSEIDTFFHSKAIDSVKKHQSATFIVSSLKKNIINGFYTITHKSLEISGDNVSSNARKKLLRYSQYDSDSDSNTYTISAFLIAQFGLNYNPKLKRTLTGNELMEKVLGHLCEIREQISGSLVYLECENKEKLINFYKENGFVEFGQRFSENENILYKQLLRFI